MKISLKLLLILIYSLLYPFSSHGNNVDISKLFKTVDPAVVVLHTIERKIDAQRAGVQVSAPGLGSGVLIDKEGHIMTAAHVVHNADKVTAEFVDGTQIKARVITSDPVQDISLLKLEKIPASIKPVKIGDSDKVNVGDRIFIIGAPYGLSHSLSVGYISGIHKGGVKSLPEINTDLFQTDAAINTGNSGGPMLNMQGELVGIVSAILSKSGGFEGLGFAVSSNAAKKTLFDESITWNGMSGLVISGVLAHSLNVPQPYGYLVQRVAYDSPADQAGLKPGVFNLKINNRQILIGGDVILAIDGYDISPDNGEKINLHMRSLKKGDKLVLRVLRAGQILELDAVK